MTPSGLPVKPQAEPRRYLAWLCEGCDECEPLDGSKPQMPCSHSPSLNGAEVVHASFFDAAVELLRETDQRLTLFGFESHGKLRQPLLAFLAAQEKP